MSTVASKKISGFEVFLTLFQISERRIPNAVVEVALSDSKAAEKNALDAMHPEVGKTFRELGYKVRQLRIKAFDSSKLLRVFIA